MFAVNGAFLDAFRIHSCSEWTSSEANVLRNSYF